MRRQVREGKRKQCERGRRERADRAHERREAREAPGRVQCRRRVAERREDDRERRGQVAARLYADEQRDPAEADDEADEARAGDPLAPDEEEREQRGEEGRRSLDHGGQPGVDPLLRPRDRDDRNRRVHEPRQHERAGPRAELARRLAHAEADEEERRERQRPDPEPEKDERRRVQLPDADLDEHEARAPERREHEQHEEVPPAHEGSNAPSVISVRTNCTGAGLPVIRGE